MKAFVVLGSIFLTVTVLLLALVSTFHNDHLYDVGYKQNNAYNHLGEELTLELTSNFQNYIENKEALSPLFDTNQALHLMDVKNLYILGKNIAQITLMLVIIFLGYLIMHDEKKKLFNKLLKTTSTTLLIVFGILVILGLNWEWFFTAFHNIFFTGNWSFDGGSLMMRLWGGNFFIIASIWVGVKVLMIALFLHFARFLTKVQSTN